MPRLTIFHIFYSTSFTVLFLILSALVLITPGDAIAQALIQNKQYYNVFILAGAYLITALIALWLYLARVLSVRHALTAIPSSVAQPPFPRRIHKVVQENLDASATLIATVQPKLRSPAEAPRHAGWAPPGGDLQGVEYASVIAGLPELLQTRLGAEEKTLRALLEPLAPDHPEVEAFLGLYERTRWRRRGRGVEEEEFRELMKSLAALVRVLDEETAFDARTQTDSITTSTSDDPGGYGYWYDGGQYRYQSMYEPDDIDQASTSLRRRCPGSGSRSRSSDAGYDGESVEMVDLATQPGGRRRLSLRASSGTFG